MGPGRVVGHHQIIRLDVQHFGGGLFPYGASSFTAPGTPNASPTVVRDEFRTLNEHPHRTVIGELFVKNRRRLLHVEPRTPTLVGFFTAKHQPELNLRDPGSFCVSGIGSAK